MTKKRGPYGPRDPLRYVQILEMRQARFTLQEIADRFHVTRQAIWNLLRTHGTRKRDSP